MNEEHKKHTLKIILFILLGILMIVGAFVIVRSCSSHTEELIPRIPYSQERKSQDRDTIAIERSVVGTNINNSSEQNTHNQNSNKVDSYLDNNNFSNSDTPYRSIPSFQDSNGPLYVAIGTFVVLLIFYIVARVKAKNGLLVLTASGWDMALILISPVCFFICWCIGFDKGEFSSFQIIMLSVSILFLISSIVISIFYNSGNFWNCIISIMAKLFIFVLTVILLFLLICWLIISILISISKENEDDVIVLKYDHFLHQYVGYRV